MSGHARAFAASDGAGLQAAAAEYLALGLGWHAAETFAQAIRAFREAGRHGSGALAAERLRSTLALCDPLHTPALAGGENLLVLTRRESEIAMLAAARHSDRVIAERLGLSVRTVQTHLARAYTKLGVTSREELRSRLLTT